ncbi:MAG: COQ9 family protein [Novosphingobium sp.]|nr:COQ9 family protein [Novosphingobium sp.]
MSASDLTLDELRGLLAPAVADAAVFDGWTDAALETAAAQHGVEASVARLAFAGGAMDMIEAWVASVDAAMHDAFADGKLAELPVRERIRSLVAFRLARIAGKEEALRRALAIMAMPQNAGRALRLGWTSADLMWRLAGDKSADYNHYTKRTILAGVYAATLAIFADDQSEGKAATLAFLDRRIAGIIRFEKAKARFVPDSGRGFSMARFLGRLRYPAR